MKLWQYLRLALVVACGLQGGNSLAYDNATTHLVLSQAALQLSDAPQLYSFLGISERAATNAIRLGADAEDLPEIFFTIRPLRHFYNAKTGHGYDQATGDSPNAPVAPTILCAVLDCTPSPDWIIDEKGQDLFINVAGGGLHSYKQAAEALYTSLTATDGASRVVAGVHVFEELGHVIHHIQDMAQPQHVRLDSHYQRAFETYVRNRNSTVSDIANSVVQRKSPAYVRGAKTGPSTAFTKAKDFWKNDAGSGLAQYTSRNFVSDGTDFTGDCLLPLGYTNFLNGNEGFQQPLPGLNSLTLVATSPSRKEAYLFFPVEDAGTAVPISQVSGFSAIKTLASSPTPQELCKWGFTQSSRTYDSVINFAIPRAINYSAGLINFFFRGQIDARVDAATQSVWIKNNGTETLTGKFELYYDDASLHRFFAQWNWTGSVPAGEEKNTSLPVPTVQTAGAKFVLVFHKTDTTTGAAPPAGEMLVAGKEVTLRPSSGTSSVGSFIFQGHEIQVRMDVGPAPFDTPTCTDRTWTDNSSQVHNYTLCTIPYRALAVAVSSDLYCFSTQCPTIVASGACSFPGSGSSLISGAVAYSPHLFPSTIGAGADYEIRSVTGDPPPNLGLVGDFTCTASFNVGLLLTASQTGLSFLP